MTDRARLPWTEDEDKMLREMNGRSNAEVAFALGRTRTAIQSRRRDLKIPSPRKGPMWEGKEDALVFFRSGGWTQEQVAEATGLSMIAVGHAFNAGGMVLGPAALDEWGWTIDDDLELRAQMRLHGDAYQAATAMRKDETVVRIRVMALGL